MNTLWKLLFKYTEKNVTINEIIEVVDHRIPKWEISVEKAFINILGANMLLMLLKVIYLKIMK